MKFKDICNFITWPWPRLLLKLPASVRFGICLLCFLLCIVFYLLPSALLHHTALFLLPMGLSSWIFSKRGACSCFAGSLGFQIGYSTMTMRNLWWPSSILFSLCAMTVMLFLEGSIIVSLRQLLDAAEAGQLRAERGERQAAIALEQQRLFNQIKNQFLLHVNHELRTPLTAVSYTLELLQMLNECGSLDHETHTLYLQKAIKQCAELTSIVNNVLDTVAKIFNYPQQDRAIHTIVRRYASCEMTGGKQNQANQGSNRFFPKQAGEHGSSAAATATPRLRQCMTQA